MEIVSKPTKVSSPNLAISIHTENMNYFKMKTRNWKEFKPVVM